MILIRCRDAQRAIREFDALLAMREDDPAQAYLGKARAALLLDDRAVARRQVLNALENSPFYRPAQKLLLELTGDHRKLAHYFACRWSLSGDRYARYCKDFIGPYTIRCARTKV